MMHRFLLHNGAVKPAGEHLVSPGQVGLLNGWGVFSTLRVKQGALFAWERHYARMKKDAAAMRVPFPQDPEAFRSQLLQLVEANEAYESTLRVTVIRNRGGMWEGPAISPDYDVIAFTTGLKVWGSGARLAIQPHARYSAMEFSGAKVLSWGMNLTWYERAQERGFDDALLLNERGQVAECTSANIFAVFGHHVYTPPLSSGCLPGITRGLLLEEISADGISVAEKQLDLSDLEAAEEVFLTSSTRDLLPVHEMEGRKLGRARRVGDALMASFMRYQEEAIRYAGSTVRSGPNGG